MAGLIRDDDIALVRERARIDEVVSSYVTLKNAGGGSQKGLCPFHDEKSPSFHVTPSRGYFHCFGCEEGGDVISFLMKIDGIGFSEAVERLADKYGVQLRYQEGSDNRPAKREVNLRPRMLEAHKVAQAYYAEQLATPDAQEARQFLDQRGFDQEAAARFGIGFAPRGGDDLYKMLRQKGFQDNEIVTGGLVAEGNRGHYDRFRGRLLWPIRETNGDVIGFGARRIFEDDRIEAKYLNTPETPIYKKSHVLYGIDLARRDIARASQAVVVEGYTDVMACHLAGVPTAVATCGTAFGEDHGRVLRRLLQDHDEFRGEVIFTFDGDAAGQKAALRAFEGDQSFAGQTYVAVEPSGLDPCDVRLQQGDAAVRELVARRIPLYRFVLGNVVGRYDLDRADSRIDALREAAKLVSAIRDRSKVEAFSRELAGMVGVDVEDARAEVRRAANRRPDQPRGRPTTESATPERPPAPPLPDLRDPRFSLERETLKLVVQHPDLVGRMAKDVDGDDFTHPTFRAVWEAVVACGGTAGAPVGEVWVSKLRDSVADPAVDPGAVGPRGRARQARPHDGVRRRPRLPAAGGDRAAAHRRREVEAAAHQPGRARDGVQPDVRRPRRPRGARPRAAREGHRRGRVRRLLGGTKVPADVIGRARLARGERALASTVAGDGSWLLGTRDALVVVGPDDTLRLPWERVETADWDREAERLRVAEVGEFGQPRPVHSFALSAPGPLLAFVRERVTASVVMQRRVVVSGRQGLLVIARRPPSGNGEVVWACEYDEGVDPDDPAVHLVAEAALQAAQEELGPGTVTI